MTSTSEPRRRAVARLISGGLVYCGLACCGLVSCWGVLGGAVPAQAADAAFASTDPLDAVVVISVRWGDKTLATPGLVIATKQGQSFVLCKPLGPYFNFGASPPPQAPEVVIQWGSSREVAGNLVNGFNAYWIVSGPAAELPAPLPRNHVDDIESRAPLTVSGLPALFNVRLANRVTKSVPLQRVYRQSLDRVAYFQVGGLEADPLGAALATDGEGRPVGVLFVGVASKRYHNDWHPLSYLDEFEKFRVSGIGLAPVSGDAATVRFEFVVSVFDTFDALRSPRLHVKFGEGYDPARIAIPVDRPAVEGGHEVPLKKRLPSQVYRDQHPPFRNAPDPPGLTTWTAFVDTPHPGSFNGIDLKIQIASQDLAGRVIYAKPQYLNYRVARALFGRAPVLPEIPGLKAP